MYPLETGDAQAAFAAGMSDAEPRFHQQGSSDGDPVHVESFEQPEIGGQVSVT